MYIVNLFKHISLVLRHKWRVFVHCAKCGIVWRGIVHDLSKFHPTELFESAKYYKGYRSPIGVCRRETGRSLAWLHHKGHNKHHLEYWFDEDCAEHPLVPYKYIVECVCDKLAATKTYAGKDYTPDKAMLHWERYGNKASANERSKKFIEVCFRDLNEKGEKYVLNKKYMKETYKAVCLDGKLDN